MSKIRLLSQDLINKIAAGEVVERPASAVKELMENSIDAGATEITLNIENGGLTKIEVIDNGSGMDHDDANTALVQHATSKLISEDDLESIDTLGFRGEALASIASVSDTVIYTFDGKTRPYKSFIKSSNIITEIGEGREKGTSVRVNNIFSKVPARRKFLKSEATEYKYILNISISIALSHPEIGFKLIKDGKIQYLLSKGDADISRIGKLFPAFKDSDFIPIHYDSPSIKIEGFVGHPSKARQDNSMQYIFINNRFVKDALISKAVKDGFSSTLMNHNYPVYFLYYKIDNSLVDVNIHPRKLEVRYSNPSAVFSATKIGVEKSLQNVLKNELINKTELESNRFTEFGHGSSPKISESSYTNRNNYSVGESLTFTKQLLNPLKSVSQGDYGMKQNTFNLNDEPNKGKSSFSNIFQVFDTYIIFEQDQKLLVVDQHAADERVNYEKLTKRFATNPIIESTDMLISVDIALSANQTELIKINKRKLEDLGFKYTVVGSKVRITAIPTIFNGQFTDQAFIELLNDIDTEHEDNSKTNKVTKKQDRLMATMACHSSIRAGQKLSTPEMEQLILNLFNCDLPYSCPHGRPIIWELTKYELEKNFKRRI